jgi:uncharacterized protein involved in exopolysaccharide biosynthesis
VSTLDTQIGQEVGVGELVDALIRSRVLVLCITAIFAAASLVAALLFPKKYEATIVISPVASNPNGGALGGLSSLASQFSGLASLAGVSTQNDSKKSESLAVLQSEALTEQYIEKHNLLPVVYASRWDPEKKQWTTHNPDRIPTLWKANLMFKDKIRSITTDTKTGLSTMKITWTDPAIAARWANDLVRLTNDYLRDKAIVESERNIAFLTEEAKRTDVVGVQQAIYSILQSEISNMMLARGNDEYALKVVDPAFAPEKPSSPLPVLWVVVGTIGGLIVSCAVVLLTRRD